MVRTLSDEHEFELDRQMNGQTDICIPRAPVGTKQDEFTLAFVVGHIFTNAEYSVFLIIGHQRGG